MFMRLVWNAELSVQLAEHAAWFKKSSQAYRPIGLFQSMVVNFMRPSVNAGSLRAYCSPVPNRTHAE